MKKFKILEELPKGDLETQSEQCCWKNVLVDLPNVRLP